jgi:hypothetical protein
MRLSDIMSAMHLSSYAEVALALFMGAFLAIAVHVLRARDGELWERARFFPLDQTPEAPRITPRREPRGP